VIVACRRSGAGPFDSTSTAKTVPRPGLHQRTEEGVEIEGAPALDGDHDVQRFQPGRLGFACLLGDGEARELDVERNPDDLVAANDVLPSIGRVPDAVRQGDGEQNRENRVERGRRAESVFRRRHRRIL
jgi:hypothetical protein